MNTINNNIIINTKTSFQTYCTLSFLTFNFNTFSKYRKYLAQQLNFFFQTITFRLIMVCVINVTF